jgi:hypothetical protein
MQQQSILPSISLPVPSTSLLDGTAQQEGEDENEGEAEGEGDASDWYWAIKHAGSDAWGTCPARRIAQWYRDVGENAYWYYWTHGA